MRLISFTRNGRASYGLVVDDGVVDAGQHLDSNARNLRESLLAGETDKLSTLSNHSADYSLDEISFLPLIADPAAKFLCVGVNYMPHIREMGRERPDYPVIFVRFADSLVGHGETMIRPSASERYDFEGELAVVIGKRARHVTAERAFDYVAGYSCFNDGSIRDFQKHGLQWTPGKNFRHSGAFGPWLVTTDEASEPDSFRLRTLLNGTVVQEESVGELCFNIPQLIEYCSTWTQLEPGDVIVTGTPGGVGAGRTPPLWMKAGDSVEVEISSIGMLRNSIADENSG